MKRRTILSILAVGLFLALSSGGLLLADPIITYQTTYLGGETWQYDYNLGSSSFPSLAKYQFLSILFSYDLYRNLLDETPFHVDWITLVFQRDIIFVPHVDGEFIASAQVNNPEIPITFQVSFEWLGSIGTAPGSQPFTIYDDDFTILSSGYTSRAGVPEPATALLLGWGLGALVLWRKRA